MLVFGRNIENMNTDLNVRNDTQRISIINYGYDNTIADIIIVPVYKT